MLFPDNEGEDKHVESKLIPRLDESSNLSISIEGQERQEAKTEDCQEDKRPET